MYELFTRFLLYPFVGQYQPLLRLWRLHRHPLQIALRQVIPRFAVQPEEDEDDDDDVPPPAQENAPEPLPGGMVVKGFFSSRVTIQQLDLSGVTESGIGPMVGSVKASDAGEDLTSRGAVLIESAAPRSTVTTDIPSLREDGVEDIFFRYEDTMTHYSVDMTDSK